MPKKTTQEEFISRANKVHNFRYDYSLVEYVNSRTKVEIICHKHGSWMANPSAHLNKSGCQLCGYESSASIRRTTKEGFIKKARAVHGGKYNYDDVVYVNNSTKVDIKCNIHGTFKQTPDDHTNGKKGCCLCGWDKRTAIHQCSTEDFIRKCKEVHGEDMFDYSEVNYINHKIRVELKCKKEGHIFLADPISTLRGCGCIVCSESKGERRIRAFLEKHDIEFISQYRLIKVKKSYLTADFYLPEYNLAIEFQGSQHYSPVDFFGGIPSLLTQSKRDIIKKHYCLQNGISFLEIPFWEQDNIEDILSESINS